MRRYDVRIINELLDRYERRRGDRAVWYRIEEKHLPEYFDASAFAYRQLHEQLEALEAKGLVTLVWKNGRRGHILEKVRLAEERTADCYAFVGRRPAGEKAAVIAEICEAFSGTAVGDGGVSRTVVGEEKPEACAGNGTAGVPGAGARSQTPVLAAFTAWVLARMEADASIRQFASLDDPGEFERLCRMIQAMETNAEEQYLRQFSVRVFRDSKMAERLAEKAASVFRRFGSPVMATLPADAVLEEYSIYRNPSWIYCKGWGRLRVRKSQDIAPDTTVCVPGTVQKTAACAANAAADRETEKRSGDGPCVVAAPDWMDLSLLQDGIGITAKDAALLQWDAGQAPDAVLTIENLTAFHQQDAMAGCPSARTLLVYIGGFAGKAKCAFLGSLRHEFPRAAFYHFGDIDCGGFLIWRSLRERTRIPIRPWRMDLATWEQYRNMGRSLTAHDRKQLEKMLEDSNFREQEELFRRMLESNVKLEQESVI